MTTPRLTLTDLMVDIVAYEDGKLTEDQIINLFQKLIDSGLAWTLQGSYGRMAKTLLDLGLCTKAVDK